MKREITLSIEFNVNSALLSLCRKGITEMLVDTRNKETNDIQQLLFAFDILAFNLSFPSPDQLCFKLSVRVCMDISISEYSVLH